jgi:AAA+ ATPase superfamily predicted ATPase
MAASNPFYERGRITDPERVFDYDKEIDKIISWLQNMQNVSIVGERRIGKSSLLTKLMAKAQERFGDEYEFHYIDLQGLENLDDFVVQALNELGKAEALSKTGATLRDLRNAIESRGQRIVLCLDEFEWSERFSDEFSGALRSMASTGHLALVVASKTKLADLAQRGVTTSPFFNIFLTLELKGMDKTKTGEFLQWSGNSAEHVFSPAEIEAAFQFSAGNPGRTVVFGYYLLETQDIRKAQELARANLGQERAYHVGGEPTATEAARPPTPSTQGQVESAAALLLIAAAVIGFVSALIGAGGGVALALGLAVISLILQFSFSRRRR